MRRTAYSSGRKEALGYKAPSFGHAPKRKVTDPNDSAIDDTPFRGRFRSRRY